MKKKLTEAELRAKIEASKIDPNKKIKSPEVLLSAGNTALFTRGAISAISGKEGSGKTWLISSMVRALRTGESLVFNTDKPDSKRVLWIDTEQSDSQLQRKTKNSYVDAKKESLVVMAWMAENMYDRLEMLKLCMSDGYDIIFIDGIRQFLLSVNDDKESFLLIEDIKQLVRKYESHVCMVIHETKTTGNTRGHLGSEINNASESIVSIENDPENQVFNVHCAKSRDSVRFNKFSFYINESFNTEICEPVEAGGSKKARSPKNAESEFSSSSEKQHLKNCQMIFGANIHGKEDFQRALCEAYGFNISKVRKKGGLFDFLIDSKFIAISLDGSIMKGSAFGSLELPF